MYLRCNQNDDPSCPKAHKGFAGHRPKIVILQPAHAGLKTVKSYQGPSGEAAWDPCRGPRDKKQKNKCLAYGSTHNGPNQSSSSPPPPPNPPPPPVQAQRMDFLFRFVPSGDPAFFFWTRSDFTTQILQPSASPTLGSILTCNMSQRPTAKGGATSWHKPTVRQSAA